MRHQLIYLRRAVQANDGRNGFLYQHVWNTGWMNLIFTTHEDAAQFIADLQAGADRQENDSV